MYKVFKETLLTEMGKNKVRMHHRTTDAQAAWKEYSEYMTTASWQVMVVNPVKTRIPLILQVQYQPLSNLPVNAPSILSMLITH